MAFDPTRRPDPSRWPPSNVATRLAGGGGPAPVATLCCSCRFSCSARCNFSWRPRFNELLTARCATSWSRCSPTQARVIPVRPSTIMGVASLDLPTACASSRTAGDCHGARSLRWRTRPPSTAPARVSAVPVATACSSGTTGRTGGRRNAIFSRFFPPNGHSQHTHIPSQPLSCSSLCVGSQHTSVSQSL